MFTKLTLAAGVVAMAAAFAPVGAGAAPAMPQSRMLDVGSLAQNVQYGYGRCRYWHRECADRWGWRTPQYFRCLARHGC